MSDIFNVRVAKKVPGERGKFCNDMWPSLQLSEQLRVWEVHFTVVKKSAFSKALGAESD
jgi:hypothetical protein